MDILRFLHNLPRELYPQVQIHVSMGVTGDLRGQEIPSSIVSVLPQKWTPRGGLSPGYVPEAQWFNGLTGETAFAKGQINGTDEAPGQ